MQCCCGKYPELRDPLLVNSTLHERLGPEGNFCGTLIAHDLRDALRRIATLEAELHKYRCAFDDTAHELKEVEAELSGCQRRLKQSQRHVQELGVKLERAEAETMAYKKQCEIEHESLAVAHTTVERLIVELAECRAKLEEPEDDAMPPR